MRNLLLAILVCFLNTSLAQVPVQPTSGDIYLALRKLNVLGSVLYVAAHPDDENTRLLTFFSKDRLYRTGYLSLTRGDGGQNLIGEEQGIGLGLIRTQELLAARRIDGAEQFFSRAYDFGYSKTPEETFAKWNKEKTLADAVWVIRQFQPDVIITRFPTTGEGGHGHHTASAIVANEAFIAAADPGRFPEQLKWVRPWQAKRILWNTFNFGGNNTTRDDQFKFDVGGYNPVLGKSYGEIAADSRSQHKSQGFGVPRSRGEALEYFQTTGGTKPSIDLFDEINTGWQRMPGGSAVEQLVNQAIEKFDFLAPHKSLPQLIQIHRVLASMPDGNWVKKKMEETKWLIEHAGGMWMEASTPQATAIQGDSVLINFVLNNRSGANVSLQKLQLPGIDSTFNLTLAKNKNVSWRKTMMLPQQFPLTQPYWLENPMAEGYFNVEDQTSIGRAESEAALVATAHLTIEGQPFSFSLPVRHKVTDPVRGELYQPLVILPPLLLHPDEELKLTRNMHQFQGELQLTAKKKNVTAVIKDIGTRYSDSVKVTFSPQQVSIPAANGTQTVSYNVSAHKDNDYHFWLQSATPAQRYYHTAHRISYDHIPFISYLTPATVRNRKLDLVTRGKRIGYITGAGDKVPDALEQMGYEVVMLGEKELGRNSLQQFDAIITGVRAYNTNEWLNLYHEKLMKYVEGGGNLIVQYNTSNQIGPVRARIGPYSFNISRNHRITDETSPVQFLKPQHPVLHYPNRITEADFKGWVQERSLYHANVADARFETVIAFTDQGEAPDSNSLITAAYGKGFFTYTGIAFFRQLPAGVPGAYRLLANLIALNQKKEM